MTPTEIIREFTPFRIYKMTPTEIIREFTPFRIYKMRFSEYLKMWKAKYNNWHHLIGTCENSRIYDLFPFDTEETQMDLEENTFIVKMHCPPDSVSYRDTDNWTYWYVRNKDMPTDDECIHTLFQFLQEYDFRDLCDLLKEWKQIYEMDLNTLDLDVIEERRRVAQTFQACGFIQTYIGRHRYDSSSKEQNTKRIMDYYFQNVKY